MLCRHLVVWKKALNILWVLTCRYEWVDINMNSVKAVDLPSKYKKPLLLVTVQLGEDTASLEIVFKLRPFVGFGSFFWSAICTWWLLLSVSEHVSVFNAFQMFSLGWNESNSPFVQSPKHSLNECMRPVYPFLSWHNKAILYWPPQTPKKRWMEVFRKEITGPLEKF